MKKPWLAALLNLLPGLGYIYIDKKRKFGWLLLAGFLTVFVSSFDPSVPVDNRPLNGWDTLAFVGILLIVGAFMHDAYLQATGKTTASKSAAVEPHNEVAKPPVVAKVATKSARRKGLLLALLAIPIGIVGWDILWNFNFIASIVSFGIAYFALKMYAYGTGGVQPHGRDAKFILVIIGAGIVLAFLSGMVMDAQLQYSEFTHDSALSAFTKADFWSFFGSNLMSAELWRKYTGEIILTIVFAVLGCYGTVLDLLDKPEPTKIS